MPLAVRHETGFAEFRINSRRVDDEIMVAKNQSEGGAAQSHRVSARRPSAGVHAIKCLPLLFMGCPLDENRWLMDLLIRFNHRLKDRQREFAGKTP